MVRPLGSHEARSAVSLVSGLTIAVFLVSWLGGWVDMLAYVGGFVSARVTQPGLFDNAGLPLPVVPMLLTPLTATLLHGSWMHLGFNFLIFIFCGRQVEMVMGRRLLLILYAAGAYAAAAGQWLMDPEAVVPMIGASGAISAIMGAYALLFSQREVRAIGPLSSNLVRMLWLGAGWIMLQLLIGVATGTGGVGLGEGAGGIAIGAHIGGFIAGMLLTRPLLALRFRRA